MVAISHPLEHLLYNKINNTTDMHKLFSTFKTLFYLPFNLTGDNFASFYTEEVAAISCQLSAICP